MERNSWTSCSCPRQTQEIGHAATSHYLDSIARQRRSLRNYYGGGGIGIVGVIVIVLVVLALFGGPQWGLSPFAQPWPHDRPLAIDEQPMLSRSQTMDENRV